MSHHPKLLVLLTLVLLVGIGAAVFAILWASSGSHEVSISQAKQRYHSTTTMKDKLPKAGVVRPAAGVYRYTGSGSEHVSVPPKTQSEGPVMPGTLTYASGGCWEFRLDFSDNHWQSATYCPGKAGLVLTARAGWYRWDFVITTVADTATYTCNPSEVIIPLNARLGQRFDFSCLGTNNELAIPPVTMSGYDEVIGTATAVVAGRRVTALHMREVARFSGGQTGKNLADTWFDAATGLPLRGTWSTEVKTNSPIGVSTLTAGGSFQLSAFSPVT